MAEEGAFELGPPTADDVQQDDADSRRFVASTRHGARRGASDLETSMSHLGFTSNTRTTFQMMSAIFTQ